METVDHRRMVQFVAGMRDGINDLIRCRHTPIKMAVTTRAMLSVRMWARGAKKRRRQRIYRLRGGKFGENLGAVQIDA